MQNLYNKQKPKLKIIEGKLHKETTRLKPDEIAPFVHREIFLKTKNGLIPKINYWIKIHKNNLTLTWAYTSQEAQNNMPADFITNKIKSIIAEFNRMKLLGSPDNVIYLDSWLKTKINQKTI